MDGANTFSLHSFSRLFWLRQSRVALLTQSRLKALRLIQNYMNGSNVRRTKVVHHAVVLLMGTCWKKTLFA
jgi:hypothetical protein